MRVRILTGQDVRRALPMAEAIEAMKFAYAELSNGNAQVPMRSRIEVGERKAVVLFMPARLEVSGEVALKTVSVFPQNTSLGLPTIHALISVIDSSTGRPLAVLEGSALTAIRTGAGSGAATDLLARSEASTAALFGSGVQARTQLEAVCAVREIEEARIYSPDRGHALAFAQEIAKAAWAPGSIEVAESPALAVRTADIVCAATSSHSPVFSGGDLRPGTHVNAIGSFTPEMQEVDERTVAQAYVVVDSREAVLAEAGDLIIPLNRGLIGKDHIRAELGEIVSGDAPGRSSNDQITLFKSVGVAVQDAAAAGLALRRAEELGLGQVVEL